MHPSLLSKKCTVVTERCCPIFEYDSSTPLDRQLRLAAGTRARAEVCVVRTVVVRAAPREQAKGGWQCYLIAS